MGKTRGMVHSQAYIRWKKETQETFDFSVLVCHAVPTLKRNLVLYDKGIVTGLVTPDHYGSKDPISREQEERTKESLREKADGYKAKLSRYILISNFSFFEAFIVDVVKELAEFHGGRNVFEQDARNRNMSQVHRTNADAQALMRRLRVVPKPGHIPRYQNAAKQLAERGYRFPSDLLSSLGVRTLFRRIDNLKAHEIPELMTEAFFLDLDQNEVDDFKNTRDVRNRIAHGQKTNLDIREVTERCQKLRQLAMKFDAHLVKHFFITERFLPKT